MVKKIKILVFFFLIGIILVGCEQADDTADSTWTFYNLATRGNYIDVSIYNDGTPSSFRLYPNQMQEVTWKNKWEGFRGGYKFTSSYSSSYTYYDCYAEYSGSMVIFYDTVIK